MPTSVPEPRASIALARWARIDAGPSKFARITAAPIDGVGRVFLLCAHGADGTDGDRGRSGRPETKPAWASRSSASNSCSVTCHAVARHKVVAIGLQPVDVARGQLDRVALGGETARDGPRHAGGRAEDQDGFAHSPSLSD
jgi:hypothetical protein